MKKAIHQIRITLASDSGINLSNKILHDLKCFMELNYPEYLKSLEVKLEE